MHHSRAKGTTLVILLGIANHSGDGGAWPAVTTLAKYGRCSRSQVQRAIADLEKLGEVRRHVQAGGDERFASHERPNRYDFLLKCPPDCDRSSQHRTRASQQHILDLDPEQLDGLDEGEGAAPMRPGQTPSHPCGPVASTRPGGAAPMRPKPVLPTTTHLPETKPSDRARALTLVWSDDRCPANWKTQQHEMSAAGKCSHCHEKPERANEQGEIA
ncbi:helix-turn-helix domain-containing protein [Microbacterium dauci]|nr:helix-turn-helix domain-containing protein [Microbacterium sp. LX3-4]